MCLISITGKKIAERNIACYKVLYYWNGKYYTPVMHKKVKDAVISGRRLYRARGIFRRVYKSLVFPYFNVVDRGWIHTYTTILNFFHGDNGVWFECVIPKGTKYWKSKFGNEYASRHIRFVKPCEEQIRTLFAERMGRFPEEDELSVIVGSIEQTKKFFKAFA